MDWCKLRSIKFSAIFTFPSLLLLFCYLKWVPDDQQMFMLTNLICANYGSSYNDKFLLIKVKTPVRQITQILMCEEFMKT